MGEKKGKMGEKKGSPIIAQLGKSGKGVIATIGEVLKKSRKKSGMTREDVCAAMKKAYGDEKRSTVNAQLSTKYPPRVGVTNGMDIEVIDGDTAADRCWKYLDMATEDQMAEWKADIKEAKTARKAAKNTDDTDADSEATEENDTSRELTKAEKKAIKKADKAAKKAAKKASKK